VALLHLLLLLPLTWSRAALVAVLQAHPMKVLLL
jgi:hypothetical protein